MKRDLMPKCIGVSIRSRMIIVSEFQKKLIDLKDSEHFLKMELLESVPKNLHKWIDGDSILDNLFNFGIADTKIYLNDDYGFGNREDIKNKMKTLGNAWKNIVSIALDESETHRIQVRLTVIL